MRATPHRRSSLLIRGASRYRSTDRSDPSLLRARCVRPWWRRRRAPDQRSSTVRSVSMDSSFLALLRYAIVNRLTVFVYIIAETAVHLFQAVNRGLDLLEVELGERVDRVALGVAPAADDARAGQIDARDDFDLARQRLLHRALFGRRTRGDIVIRHDVHVGRQHSGEFGAGTVVGRGCLQGQVAERRRGADAVKQTAVAGLEYLRA